MGDGTGIEWTDATWNPIRGCSRVSDGCRNCYAEQQAARTNRQSAALGRVGPYEGLVKLVGAKKEPRWTGVVRVIPEHLADPLRWRKPRRVFVNSMSDLFHESLTNEQIAAVFGVMAAAHRHTFQILTKRARRMREWFEWVQQEQVDPLSTCGREAVGYGDVGDLMPWLQPVRWPLDHVWIGVSVENQAAAVDRIPDLQRTPAAVRFLSCEPLLGPVDLTGFLGTIDTCDGCTCGEPASARADDGAHCEVCADAPATVKLRGPDWVIVGCESGPGARDCDVSALLSLIDQCDAAGVACFVKQWRAVPGIVEAGEGSHMKGGGIIGAPYVRGRDGKLRQHLAFPVTGSAPSPAPPDTSLPAELLPDAIGLSMRAPRIR